MKSAGRLTGDLLARKGRAAPIGETMVAQILPHIRNGHNAIESVHDREALQAANEAEHKKVAMTLRLDNERHMKLRLLSAMKGRSCQNLLIEALDDLLLQQAAELDPHLWRCLNRLSEQ